MSNFIKPKASDLCLENPLTLQIGMFWVGQRQKSSVLTFQREKSYSNKGRESASSFHTFFQWFFIKSCEYLFSIYASFRTSISDIGMCPYDYSQSQNCTERKVFLSRQLKKEILYLCWSFSSASLVLEEWHILAHMDQLGALWDYCHVTSGNHLFPLVRRRMVMSSWHFSTLILHLGDDIQE